MAVLVTCCSALLLTGLATSIVNVALPSIGRAFHAPTQGLQWVVDAYTVTLAALLMLGGSNADRFSRRRVFLIGLVVFLTASLLSGFAPSLRLLIACQILQGVGASMLNPVALSIITNVFTDPRERARAIGLWGSVIGISLALGPVAGGLLVSTLSWRAVFWISVPIASAAIIAARLVIPESHAATHRRIDVPGQLLVSVFLGTVVAGIIESAALGWRSPIPIGLLTVAVISLAGFIVVELHHRAPLVYLGVFRSVRMAGASAIGLTAFAALNGALFIATLYLQSGRGLSPILAGITTLPLAITVIACAPVSGRLVAARRSRTALMIAGAATAAGGLLFELVTTATPLWLTLAAFVLIGAGFGFVNAPITSTAVAALPPTQAGVAASIASTSRQIGAAIGVATAGALLGSTTASTPAAAHATSAWALVIICGLLGLLIGAATAGRATAGRKN
jgi:EmrB/QacA subfamily drug resistance transporter